MVRSRAVRNKLVGTLFPYVFRPDARRTDLIRIGSGYGGWWVPRSYFNPTSICYSAGVGTDISFDLGLAAEFGCHVWGIDPTPESLAWIKPQPIEDRFTMMAYALAGEAGTRRFYKPMNLGHVSHSITNLQQTDDWIDVECATVAELMRSNGHPSLTLLKLDVEGAQHEVIESVISDGVRPAVLCIEFDQPEPLSRTRSTVHRLRSVGYSLVKVDWFNMTFVL